MVNTRIKKMKFMDYLKESKEVRLNEIVVRFDTKK